MFLTVFDVFLTHCDFSRQKMPICANPILEVFGFERREECTINNLQSMNYGKHYCWAFKSMILVSSFDPAIYFQSRF